MAFKKNDIVHKTTNKNTQIQESLQGAHFALGFTKQNAEVVQCVLRAQRRAELRTTEVLIW